MSKVLAIVITYNIDSKFRKVIDSIEKQVDEILVVDNGSNLDSQKVLKSLGDKISLIELNDNLGIATALNRGIEYAQDKDFDWILTLDHDSIAEKEMIKVMLDEYKNLSDKEKKDIVMITPKHVEEKLYTNNSSKIVEDNSMEYVLTEITSGSLVKKSYYEKYKYDDKLFIDLVDHDFCLKINLNGKKIMKCNSAILFHNLGDSVEKSILGIKCMCTNHSPIRRYYMTRNRLYIWNKYKNDFPGWIKRDKVRFLSETGKVILFEDMKANKIKMTYRGIKDYKKK